ncbi:MAG: DUF4157 domain-containing protein [Cyanobacteriota bacterium]
MNGLLQRRLDKASRFGHNFANVAIAPPENTPGLEIVQPIQTKLTLGLPGDKYEQEADSVAEQVMRMPDSAVRQPVQREAQLEDEEEVQTKPLAAFITPLVQREAMLEEEPVQAKPSPTADTQQPTQSLESQLNNSKSRGSPLSDEVRSFMEPRFGFNFSQVRAHTDSEAVQMNRELNAQAFTQGNHIYFGEGKSPAKDQLTAHEMTHVVQQSPEISLAPIQKKLAPSELGNKYKLEVDRIGHQPLAHQLTHVVQQGETIQCFSHELTNAAVRLAIKYNKQQNYKTYTIEHIQQIVGADDDGIIGSDTVRSVAKWQAEKGLEPDGKIGPETFARLHYEFATDSYGSKEEVEELSFSEEEKRWIQEVFKLPEFSLLFRTYTNLPPTVLHRVKSLNNSNFTEGGTKGSKLAIYSKAYTVKDNFLSGSGKIVAATKEEEFKSTLIHELLHFLENNTIESKDHPVVPATLIKALIYPELTDLNLPPYAFGWFEHPKTKLIYHFDSPGVISPHPNVPQSIFGTALEKIKKEGKYEHSPMPQSGNAVSPEEDLAETFSLYLTSTNSRLFLMHTFPWRFHLIVWYFKSYLASAAY